MKSLLRYEVHMLCGGISGTFTKYRNGEQQGCGDGRSLLKELGHYSDKDKEEYKFLFIFIGSKPSVTIKKLINKLGEDVFVFNVKKERMKKSNLREEYFLSQTFGTGYDRYSSVPSDFIADEELPELPEPRVYHTVEMEKITGFFYNNVPDDYVFNFLKGKLKLKTERKFLLNWLKVNGTDLLTLYEAVFPNTRFLSDDCFMSRERIEDIPGSYGTWSVLYFSAKDFMVINSEERHFSEKLSKVLKKCPPAVVDVFEKIHFEAAPSGSTFRDQIRTMMVTVMGEKFINTVHAPRKMYERLLLPEAGVIPVMLEQTQGSNKEKVIAMSLEMAVFSQVSSEQILKGLVYFFSINLNK